MSKSISFLLGAGFSYPMGYPIGNSMEQSLYDLMSMHIQKYYATQQPWEKVHLILQEMIRFYNANHPDFNYEEFYEYIDFCCNDERISNCLNYFRYGEDYPIKRNLSYYKKEYQWYIYNLIKDKHGKQFYGEQDTEQLSRYEKFIEALKALLDKGYEINVHTLNHDLLFESFKNSQLIGNEICDGFDNENSPYRGKNGENEYILPYYNGIYGKRIRLYKLHGSIDQYNYLKGGVYLEYDNHIKIINCVDEDKELYKFENGRITDEFKFRDLHPDFLTGTYSKIEEYDKNPLCRKLFPLFIDNLKNADCLIVIGYGAKDDGINKLIQKNIDNKPRFIFDPSQNTVLEDFANKINAVIIREKVENFELPNF